MNIPEGFHLAGNGLIITNNEWFALKLMSLSFLVVAIILLAWLRWGDFSRKGFYDEKKLYEKKSWLNWKVKEIVQ